MSLVSQEYLMGDVRLQGERDATTPFFLSSRHGYLVGSIGGQVTAYGAEHLVGRMGGLWMHPLRVLHGWELHDGEQPIASAEACRVHDSTVLQMYRHHQLKIEVQTQLCADYPGMICHITVANQSAEPWHGHLRAVLALTFHGCWYGGASEQHPAITNHGHEVSVHAAQSGLDGWAVVGRSPGMLWESHPQGIATAVVTTVPPHTTHTMQWWLVVSHASAAQAAKQARLLIDTPHTPPVYAPAVSLQADQSQSTLAADWAIACHNMNSLIATYPDLPTYMLAGIPEYPQLFGCDTTYSIPGMMAAGFADVAKSALLALAHYAQRACGRIPHEVTTNGRVFHPGNAQETPQFVVACWDYVMWSGDIAFAEHVYPLCVEGMTHMQGVLEGRHWPYGDGMVERHGMGPFKLDSVAYLYQALNAIAELATAIQRDAEAQHWRDMAQQLQMRFETDWWVSAETLYADSLQRDRAPQLDYHWTAVVPLYTQLARDDRQLLVYERIRRDFVNEWGLMHTRNREPAVWTLPTGLLALAAFQRHDGAYGYTLLRNIAHTAYTGSLGLMKELIPEGLCFVQLWSAALYVQGIVEGMCGVHPRAHEHLLTLDPCIPEALGRMQLRGLNIGAHRVDLILDAHCAEIVHQHGPCPITVRFVQTNASHIIDAGERIVVQW